MPAIPAIALLIVAAGRGSRFSDALPKQYHDLGGKPVLAHVLAAGRTPLIDRVLCVIHPDDAARLTQALMASGLPPERAAQCNGGESRQESVRFGLEMLAASHFPEDGIVLIHDAARPFLSEAMIGAAIAGAARHGAVIPVLPVVDTLATLDAAGHLAGNPDRSVLRAVQTPQAFRFGDIREAHRRAAAEARTDFTDDASLLRAYGQTVQTIAGDPDLFKITQAADLTRAEAHLLARGEEVRSGLGYDVHAFAPGDHLMLGGVRIAHGQKLAGHSDADPVLHALVDALLGTIGDGDIGSHFPPSDPQWKGADSRVFLEAARDKVRLRGGRIVSVDCTIVCEAPKVGPHRAAMQAAIGGVLGLSADRVGIKATTSEGLGFTGRREGIAAMAMASVAFPRG